MCRFDRSGPLCEHPISIRNAAFNGDSYLSHRIETTPPDWYQSSTEYQHPNEIRASPSEPIATGDDDGLSMRLKVRARTRATDGLILLASAQGTHGSHYMALFLHKGLLQFQFSCGLQTMLLSELETPVNTGHEIWVQAE